MEDYKKKYKEALEKAKTLHKLAIETSYKNTRMAIEELFPELKKSEDERIRKVLKSFFDSEISDYGNVEWRNGIRYGEIVAWLKKQGELIEKYEDKLDRCACESFDKGYKAATEKIDAIENFDTEFEKQVSHLIASTINKEHEYNEGFVKWTSNALLNYAKHELEKQVKQKPAWSEEDENGFSDTLYAIQQARTIAKDENDMGNLWYAENWLKSIKERMKGECISVTDEELAQAKKDAYNDALDKIEYHSGEPTFDDGWSAAIWYLKKKNAQPQNTWKPSGEQMEIIYKYSEQNNYDGSVLTSLYRDLKKLKEKWL